MSYLVHTKPETWTDRVLQSVGALAPIKDDFETIVVTGISGLAVGAVVAHLMNKQLVVIRKKGEHNHGTRVEGPVDWKHSTYIFLDDFVVSGGTIDRMIEHAPHPLYVYLYSDHASEWRSEPGRKWEAVTVSKGETTGLYQLVHKKEEE